MRNMATEVEVLEADKNAKEARIARVTTKIVKATKQRDSVTREFVGKQEGFCKALTIGM